MIELKTLPELSLEVCAYEGGIISRMEVTAESFLEDVNRPRKFGRS